VHDTVRKSKLEEGVEALAELRHLITLDTGGRYGSVKGRCVELLLRESLGRAPQAEEQAAPRLPATAAAVSTMAWSELQLLASTLVADEIVAVVNGGGRELLRERLERLSEDERRMLRNELAAMGA
jgi:hypothetical protein